MKTCIRLSICLVLIMHISQYSLAQVFGIRAGLTMANMGMEYNGVSMSEDFKMKPGFLLGPTVEFPISPIFAVETGLLVASKGFKVDEKESYQGQTMEMKSKLNLLYIDVPIALKGKINVDDKTNLFLSAGPYLGFGLTGKLKSEYSYNGETESDEEDIKFGSDEEEDDLQRLDYGLIFGAGVESGHFQFSLNYGLGLADISNVADDDSKIKNKVVSVSVAYRFIQN